MRSRAPSLSKSNDALFQVEQQIARRADELARQSHADRDRALDCWLQAEREFWNNADVGSLLFPSHEPCVGG